MKRRAYSVKATTGKTATSSARHPSVLHSPWRLFRALFLNALP